MQEPLSDISSIENYFSEISKFDKETTMKADGSTIYDPNSRTTYQRTGLDKWSGYGPFAGEWSRVNPELNNILELLRVMKLRRKK